MNLLDTFQVQDPQNIVDFILNVVVGDEENELFRLTEGEESLLASIHKRRFTGEPTSAQDLHELRILYWQVVGFMRRGQRI